jgi:predicted transport protein
MSDIKLFSLGDEAANELAGACASLEKDLQNLIEGQMEAFLGVRFLASEYSTGKTHKGRIDSLGLDENNCPVIVEYKRNRNENVINQGLFYLDWLLDHQAEFQLLVMKQLDKDLTEAIEWQGTRLICIAADFNKYDEHAVQQINRNIELMRYRYFGDDLLLLELVNAQTVDAGSWKANLPKENPLNVKALNVRALNIRVATDSSSAKNRAVDKTHEERVAESSPELVSLYEQVCDFANELGDEVQRKDLKLYAAFKKIKNFLSVVVLPQKKDPRLHLYLKLPASSAEGDGFTRDVSNIGHWGTGDFEVVIRTQADLEKAKSLIVESYQKS